jgi:hypothetical protein
MSSQANAIFTLPHGTSTQAVADACRVALLAFLRGSAGWGKHQLAAWLTGPYAALTSLAPACDELRSPPSQRWKLVDARALERVMREARDALLGAMRLASYTNVTPAYDLVRHGALMRCQDEEGNKGWIPVDVPGMRLVDRARTLWAIDHSARPEDYRERFLVCPACRWPVFDSAARRRGVCCSPVSSDVFMITPHEVMSKMSG